MESLAGVELISTLHDAVAVQSNRRRFLRWVCAGTVVSAGAGAAWVKWSNTRAARLARMIVADTRRRILPAPATPSPGAWSENDITVSWLGHSTVLINFYGIKILTDPALGNQIGVSLGIGTVGPKRYVAPALKLRDLPRIDVLLLSHAHMDHMDIPTLASFAPETFTITARKTSDVIAGTGLRSITELGWSDHTVFRNAKGDLRIEAFEVKHWGQRWPNDGPRGYNGYVLRREGKSILFAGDTAHTPLFAGLSSNGPFELAVMPIGAYNPWIRNHCTPEEAVDMANAAGARFIVPVHHQTFRLSNEPRTEPIERFRAALNGESERIALDTIGKTFVCPA